MKLLGWPVLRPSFRMDRGHPQPRCFALPEQFILCSDPVAAGGVLFPFPCCFSPSRHPGQLGDYRKSTRLLPLVEDNGCVRHELQGQPRQRGFVCDLD